MDPQVAQQLQGLLQQMLQVLQSAGAGQPGQPTQGQAAPPPPNATGMGGNVPPGGDDWDDEDGDDDSPMAPPGADTDDDKTQHPGLAGKAQGDQPPSDKGGGDAASALHDRVDQLERHTGLKKSAGVMPIGDRIDALEFEYLGENFEGTFHERVDQLERVLGKTAAAVVEAEEEAPDEIHLDDLIKTAVAQGVEKATAEIKALLTPGEDAEPGLPDPATLRKQAKTARFGQPKGQTTVIAEDADLVKSAQQWGFDDDDLDAPVGFGDFLQMQYLAQRDGVSILPDDDADAIDPIPD